MPNVGQLLAASGLPRHEAQSLLARLTGMDRVAQIAHPERVLAADQCVRLEALFARRRSGEPLAYILGEREFWGLRFKITPAVLIPRAETELLVALALERLPAAAAAGVLDLGTGSGVVAVALAHERPRASVTAVDISEPALAVARENARCHGVQVSFVRSHWFSALAGEGRCKFDLIAGNPPYIAETDPHLARGDLPHEPRGALASGPDGLSDLGHIVAQAPQYLLAGGWLLLEHGFDQGPACRDLFHRAGLCSVQTWPDLAGLPRVTGGCVSRADALTERR